eukprot:TRINITY_DN7268_c0_g2_i1.p1 TRINITY_DN7268_c0_g2~~TRINITY_DN7268_c0_g2_i1.p1  ORF type:complete len:281 (+),score=63.52 TRINITY_DN7268_c0_g2_i1:110-952(+)
MSLEVFLNMDSECTSFNDNNIEFLQVHDDNLVNNESYCGNKKLDEEFWESLQTNFYNQPSIVNSETICFDSANSLDFDTNDSFLSYSEDDLSFHLEEPIQNNRKIKIRPDPQSPFRNPKLSIRANNFEESKRIPVQKKLRLSDYQENNTTSPAYNPYHQCQPIIENNPSQPNNSGCQSKRKDRVCSIHKVSIEYIDQKEIKATDDNNNTEIYVKKSYLMKNIKNNSIKHRIKTEFKDNDLNTLSFKTRNPCDCIPILKSNNCFSNGHQIYIKKSAYELYI